MGTHGITTVAIGAIGCTTVGNADSGGDDVAASSMTVSFGAVRFAITAERLCAAAEFERVCVFAVFGARTATKRNLYRIIIL